MDVTIEALARLLYRNDPSALADLQAALSDWLPFYRKYGTNIGVDMRYLEKHFGVSGANPWEVLLDVGILHQWVFEADWREFADEIVNGLRALRPAQSLAVDWEKVAENDPEAEALFRAVQSEVRPLGETLVILDKASDSYPLAFLPVGVVAEAQQLAGLLGRGEVVIVGGCG